MKTMLKTKTNVKLTTVSENGLSLFLFLLTFGGLSLLQPALAAITMITGDNQQIETGLDSAEMVFLVTNDEGNFNQGIAVNFNLVNPTGNTMNVGLSNFIDETDDNGRVSTRFHSTGIIGNYTITATLMTDTTQFASNHLTVVVGPPAKLTVTQGDHQTIIAGKNSADILFKLTDAFDNPIVEKVIDFELKKPSGEVTYNGMYTALAITDGNGEAITYLNATDIQGIYTIIATLPPEHILPTNATIDVIVPPPQGPSLGLGGAINKNGELLETNAVFHGGIEVNGTNSNQEVVIAINDTVLIKGEIKVDSNHVGKSADLFILIGYKPLNETEMIVTLDHKKVVQLWDGKIKNLVSFQQIDNLSDTPITLEIYEGPLVQAAELRIYFGYRLSNSVTVFNANQMLSIVIF